MVLLTRNMSRYNVGHIGMYWREVLTTFSFRPQKTVPLVFRSGILGYSILLVCCWHVLNVHGFEESNISYVDECKADCATHRDPFTCGKFRAVQWLHNLTTDKDIHYGTIRFVRLPSTSNERILPKFLKTKGLERYSKFLNFVRSSVEDMLTRRAIVYTVEPHAGARSLSSGPVILDTDDLDELVEYGRSAESRLHKKKKKTFSLIVPMLILLKVLKIKLLLIPILLGVHFIKKILLLGALTLPSILGNLKYCKMPPMHHPTAYSTWATAAEAPIDFSVVPGHDDGLEHSWNQKMDVLGYGAGTHDAHAASARNPYRGYYQTLKQQQLQNMMQS